MQRRHFLWTLGAAALMPPAVGTQAPQRATVLYDGRATALARISPDPKQPDALWVQKTDLPRINDFELKPQRVGQRVVADLPARVWSFGEIPVVRGAFLESRMAPDFSVPDRKGRPVKLSQFLGKKVLLVTWASW